MSKQINDIPYVDILKKAWRITWTNKYLWWFGLFLTLAGGASFNWNSGDWNRGNQKEQEVWQKMTDFSAHHMGIIIALIVAMIVLYLVFVVLATFSRGGLIKSIEHIEKKEPTGFKVGLREGKKYFWRLLGLSISVFLFFFLVLIVLFTPVIFLFYSGAYVGGVLLAVCAALIFVPLAILTFFVKNYANIYIVSGEISVWPAVENSSDLFLKNILSSIIMALLFIPVSIVMGIGIVIVLFFLLLIFGMIVALLYFTLGMIPAIIAGVIGLSVFIVLVLGIRSVYEVFSQSAWLLFFQEIASQKEEEKATETVIEPEASPNAFSAPSDAVKTLENEK